MKKGYLKVSEKRKYEAESSGEYVDPLLSDDESLTESKSDELIDVPLKVKARTNNDNCFAGYGEKALRVYKKEKAGNLVNVAVKANRNAIPKIQKKGSTSIPENDSTVNTLACRTNPKNLFSVIESLNDDQQDVLRDMGFGSLIGMKVNGVPTNLGFYIVDNFDPESMRIKLEDGFIEVTGESIQKMIGLRNGGRDILQVQTCTTDNKVFKAWKEVYNNRAMKMTDICKNIISSPFPDMIFKIDFIVLVVNALFETYPGGICKTSIVPYVLGDVELYEIDWCSYIIKCLKTCKDSWKRNEQNSAFTGPFTILLLLYLYYTDFPIFPFPRKHPCISSWNIQTIRLRESSEVRNGGFGRCPFIPDTVLGVEPPKQIVGDLTERFRRLKESKCQLRTRILKELEMDKDNLELKNLFEEFDQEFSVHTKDEKKDPERPVPLNSISIINPTQTLEENKMSPISCQFAVMATEASVSRSESDKSFVPKFHLGLTDDEEEGGVQKNDEKKRGILRRNKKSSAACLSHFITQGTHMATKLTPEEEKVSNRLFALMGDVDEPIFKTSSGISSFRQVFESFYRPCWLYSSLIDIWCYFLNIANLDRDALSPFRYFVKIGSIVRSLTDESMRNFIEYYEPFKRGLLDDMKDNIELQDFKKVDLVFFPIHYNGHYYLICFDLRKPAVMLIDNASRRNNSLQHYRMLPANLKHMFVRYLEYKEHKCVPQLKKCKIMSLAFEWKTLENQVDCGVFLMRHMESFDDTIDGKWHCGFKKESEDQIEQLHKLRRRYATKMLMSDDNLLKHKVIKEANSFSKLPKEKVNEININAEKIRKERVESEQH